MKCTFCKQEIVLTPSARERAAKDVSGRTAADYTAMFTSHSDCLLLHRDGRVTGTGGGVEHKGGRRG